MNIGSRKLRYSSRYTGQKVYLYACNNLLYALKKLQNKLWLKLMNVVPVVIFLIGQHVDG